MTINFLTGLVGSIILVMGAAYPDKRVKFEYNSIKNRLLAVGAMLIY